MLKFTVFQHQVVMDTSVLLIKEFTDILEYCKKKPDGEKLGNQFLLYIYYCCDLQQDNPLRDIDYRMKEVQANKRAFNSAELKVFTPKEQTLVDAAIDAYNFFNETALERASLTFDKKIDEVRTLLESMRPESHAVYKTCVCANCLNEEVDVIDKYVSNAADLEKFAAQLNNLATYKLRALETAKKIENTGRVRGSKGSSLIERGVFLKAAEKGGNGEED